MRNADTTQQEASKPNVIQLKPSSLIVLCVSLIATTATCMGLVTFGVLRSSRHQVPADYGKPLPLSADNPETNPPWGELVKYDLEVEQPDEYVAFEPITNRVAKWFFPGKSPAQVRSLLQTLGMGQKLIEQALASSAASLQNSQTAITPTDHLTTSLSPEVRKKIYAELGQYDSNHYMRFPYCFMTNRAEEFFLKSGVSEEIVGLVSKLTYERNGKFYFSDVEMVMNRIPTDEERQVFFKTLSRSSVVMARLRIRPDTDIDKLLGYWSGENFVRQKDISPLLESLKRRDGGGTLSLVYLLPPFARERLFTSPLPSQPGDPAMDCHWTAMNFFNDEPDPKFSDLTYTAAYVKTNYYQIAQPTSYGDIVFFLDHNGNAIHSAVYIADDIIFTKNGNNFAQPWVMMRLPNLLALYSVGETPRIACYRHKNS